MRTTKKMKLGTAVCVFCKHCSLNSEYHADWADAEPGGFLCKNCPNQEIVHPVTGKRLYIYYSETPVNEAFDIMHGTSVDEKNLYQDSVKVDIYFTSIPFQYCEGVNRWGFCKEFERISESEEEKRFGKKKQSKKQFSHLMEKIIDEDNRM